MQQLRDASREDVAFTSVQSLDTDSSRMHFNPTYAFSPTRLPIEAISNTSRKRRDTESNLDSKQHRGPRAARVPHTVVQGYLKQCDRLLQARARLLTACSFADADDRASWSFRTEVCLCD